VLEAAKPGHARSRLEAEQPTQGLKRDRQGACVSSPIKAPHRSRNWRRARRLVFQRFIASAWKSASRCWPDRPPEPLGGCSAEPSTLSYFAGLERERLKEQISARLDPDLALPSACPCRHGAMPPPPLPSPEKLHGRKAAAPSGVIQRPGPADRVPSSSDPGGKLWRPQPETGGAPKLLGRTAPVRALR